MLLALSLVATAYASGTWVVLDGPLLLPHPGVRPVAAQDVASAEAFGHADEAALANLRAELLALGPLFDVFDGELEVLRRLDAALAPVRLVRPEDADAVWRARVVHGRAVYRTFQDDLATDPSAERYRAVTPAGPAVASWVDAIVTEPERVPDAALLPEEAARLAYQELRARVLLLAPATVRAVGLGAGDSLVVDGRARPTALAQLGPGVHDLAVVGTDGVRVWQRARLAGGQTLVLTAPPSTEERRQVARQLADGVDAPKVGEATRSLLTTQEGPVRVVAADTAGARVYLWDGGVLHPERRARPAGRGWSLAAGGGAAWVYDGDYLLLNGADGAPPTRGTVNAAAPVVQVAGAWQGEVLRAGGGVDVAMPLGEWQALPSGDGAVRPRTHAYGAIGVRWAMASVGFLAPWHLTVGGRARLPLGEGWSLDGSYAEGIGLSRAREGGPDFVPAAARLATLGVTWGIE